MVPKRLRGSEPLSFGDSQDLGPATPSGCIADRFAEKLRLRRAAFGAPSHLAVDVSAVECRSASARGDFSMVYRFNS
jgi:hypothetical protein